LAVLAFSLRQVLRFQGGEDQILGIANLLIFLQIILLFQQKDARIYGQLTMLSLLQVVVAALFNQGLWFGVLLLVEFAVGLSALVLLFLLRQWHRYRPTAPLPQRAAAGRWPLAGLQSAFVSASAGTAWAGIGRELFGRLTVMGLGTLLLTLLMFFTVPRFGQATWQSALIDERHVVGFTDTVTLGELGEVVESPEEVMRLQLLEQSAGSPYAVQEAVYLRGAILTYYRRGQWAPVPTYAGYAGGQDERGPGAYLPREGGAAVPASPSLVKQKITIEPLDRPELFCVWPFVVLSRNDAVQFDVRRQRLVRAKNLRSRRFSFELGTTAFVEGAQVPLIPCREPLDTEQLLQLSELPRLIDLARRWDQEADLPPEDHVGRAHNLEQKLRDSGMFQYSLEGQSRNPALDPIEDFIAQHPQGHCEYFATALALMLRSQQIPSRVVVGYRCDDWNDLGGFYDVRQLHAHTWVEAYLTATHIPTEVRYGDPRQWAAGGWLRLDATPGTGEGETILKASMFDWLRHGFRWLQSLWVDYVVEMDQERQRDEIYQPVFRAVVGVFRRLFNLGWWRSLAEEIGEAMGFFRWGRTGGWWIGMFVIALLGLLLLRLGYRGLRWAARSLWGRLAGRPALAVRGGPGEVEFYRRLEILLARHGLIRPAGQTQREFAAAAGIRVAYAAGQPQLATLPIQVAEAFYRVRFGRLPLDNPQAEAVEHALAELSSLESALS
jgi:hypothetical protein